MNDLPDTRHSLLVRLAQRSDDAWAEFLTVYERAIYSFCRAKGLQDADARDVTQNVFTAVHSRIDDRVNVQGTFRRWLFCVARNTVVDLLVERGRRAAVSGDTRVVELLAETPESKDTATSEFWLQYRRSLFHHVARQVKQEVRERTWQSFWMTAVVGKRADQVADELGISVGSVYTAKCRVVARIRHRVSALDDDDDRCWTEEEVQCAAQRDLRPARVRDS